MTDKSRSSGKRSVVDPARRRDLFVADSLPSAEIVHLSRLITIGELSACFAHEVFNPLTLIRGHLRLIDERIASNHPVRGNLQVIQRASKRIEEMADRMLGFSRKRTPRTEECKPVDLVEDALRFLEPYIHGQQVVIELDVEPNLPPLKIEQWEMVQVFVNLIQNAVESMDGSDLRILRIHIKSDGADIRFSVSDTGCGISVSDLPQVFDPFFTTKGELGTGLGLYIAKRIIEEHRGTITVESNSAGTTFVVILSGDSSMAAQRTAPSPDTSEH